MAKINNRLNIILSQTISALTPLLATLAALGIFAIILAALGANPVEAYGALIEGAVGSPNAIADTLVKATPLLLIGLGTCIAFRGGVVNIGGEGQLVVGALAATLLGLLYPEAPGYVIIPLAMLAGFLAGGVWGAIPGALKAYFNVNEILSTIMMNQIAVQGMNFLLRGPMIDPVQLEAASKIPQTARLAKEFDLIRLVPTRLHLGALLAVIVAVLVYIFLVAHDDWIPYPSSGLERRCCPLCRDQCQTLHCVIPAVERCAGWSGRCSSSLRRVASHVH